MWRTLCLGITVLLSAVAGKHLWFETPPPWDDDCTIVTYGLKRFERYEVRWPMHCREGGLIWLGTTGRLHTIHAIEPTRTQEFMLCLTGGLPERLHVMYNYAGHHMEPMVSPIWYMRPRWHEICKKSINGTMELLMESPMHWIDYFTYMSFNITEIDDYQPKPQPPNKPWGATPEPEEEDEEDEEEETAEDILADEDMEDGRFEYY